MELSTLLGTALGSLFRNKLRSSLTVFGIMIGIAAVICVVAIGRAGQARVEQALRNLGDNFVWIEAGGRAVNGVSTGPRGANSLSIADAEAIRAEIPLIKNASPNVDASTQVVHRSQNWFVHYRGVAPEYFEIKNWEIEDGAVFSHADVERAAAVCVIGRTVRRELFGPEPCIGKVVRLKDMPCKVIATLKPRGVSLSGQDQDDTLIVPITTAQKRLMGQPFLDDILCSAISQDLVKEAGRQVAGLLRERHHLRPEEGDDFNIRNPEDAIQAQLESSRTLTLLLIAVASISLVVGGIGIMNVMLVSVTERTREIGVRVAVGATEEAIQLQFLGESVLLSLVGGAAGVGAGLGGSLLLERALGWPVEMSPDAVAIAAVFAILVGVFFGYYPARKASRLDPIEALRYE